MLLAVRRTLLAIAGLVWNLANVLEAWRYERHMKLRLASPKRPALVIRFVRRRG